MNAFLAWCAFIAIVATALSTAAFLNSGDIDKDGYD